LLPSLGVGLYLAVAIWQTWTDNYFARYFSQENAKAVPMDHGPHLHLRHPRYSAAIVAKIALALASVLGWVLAAAWTIVMLRKICNRRGSPEECLRHPLRGLFQKDSKGSPGNLLRSAELPGYKSSR